MPTSVGGPLSKKGEAIGASSAFTVTTPSSGISGNGVPNSSLTPTITRVLPRVKSAEPFAFSMKFVFIVISLTLSSERSSIRVPLFTSFSM